jgi:hypothetical protein
MTLGPLKYRDFRLLWVGQVPWSFTKGQRGCPKDDALLFPKRYESEVCMDLRFCTSCGTRMVERVSRSGSTPIHRYTPGPGLSSWNPVETEQLKQTGQRS